MQDAIAAYDPQTMAAIKTPAGETDVLAEATGGRGGRVDRIASWIAPIGAVLPDERKLVRSAKEELAKYDSHQARAAADGDGGCDGDDQAAADLRAGGRQLSEAGARSDAGLSRIPGRERTANHARRGSAEFDRPPLGAGQVADAARSSADGAGDGQSAVAVSLRPGHRRHAERFRRDGRQSIASGIARLAGVRIRRQRLALEGDAAADRAVGHVLPVVERRSRHRRPRRLRMAADAADNLLWHARRQRLEGEAAARCDVASRPAS